MGTSQQHNISVVVTEQGLSQVQTAMNNFATTSGTVVKSQDALADSMGKTQGAAIKTGKEFQNVDKTEKQTVKSTGSLGQAFKNSALQLTAFVSGLVSTVMQVNSVLAAENKLNKQRELLNKKTIALQAAELKYNTGLANGTLTGEKARIAGEKLDSMRKILALDTEKLEIKEREHTASLTQLALSAIPTVISGISSASQVYNTLKGTIEGASGSVDEGAESMDALGTAADTATTTGLIPTAKQILTMIPGVDRLAKAVGIGKTDGLSGSLANNGAQLAEHNKFSNVFINAFKNMGSSIKDFASKIKIDMGNATGVLDKMKAGFTSFFSQIGAGFTGLGGSLKGAGTAIKGFASTLASAFISNPILGVITAIAAAIVGLVFNVGGFRDRLNELGVTLGKMAPWAKPFLDALGWIGEKFAEVGDWIMGTNHLASATTAAGQAARKAADDFDTHFQAIQKSFNVSQDFAKFEGIVQNLKNVKTAIAGMTETTDQFGTKTVQNLGNATNAFETFNSGIVKGVPEVDAKVKQIQATFEGMRQGTITLADGQKLLGKQLGELDTILANNIKTNKNKIAVEKESALSMKGTTNEMTNAQKVIQGYNADIKASEDVFHEFAIAYVEGNYKIIDAMGLTDEEIGQLMDRFKKDYPEGAVVVEQSGQKIIKSVQDIKKETDLATKDMGKVFEDVSKVIKDNLPPTLADVQLKIRDVGLEEQYMADVSKLAAAGITKDKAQWADAVMNLAKKYPELNKGTKIVEDLQKATEDQTKEQAKATKATDDLATAQEKAQKMTEEWKKSVDDITQSFQTFATKGTSTLSQVGNKLIDITDKARAANEEFISGEGKRKERKEKFHETMMQLYDEEGEAIGNLSAVTVAGAQKWAEYEKMSTAAVNNFAASALTGEFPVAISEIATALDEIPGRWKGASGQLEEVLSNTALNARDKANLISADMGMLENAMKPVQVGAEFVGKAGAEAAAGLDELAAASLKNVNPMTQMDDAWKTFTASLTPAQKQLGLVQAVMKGVESGAMTTAQGFQTLEAAGVKASQQIGKTVTTSLQNLEHQIIQLGNGTSTTVAKMDGQWVNLGNSASNNLGPGGAQGQVQNLEGTLTGLGTTATNELGSTVPGAMSTASTSANTQFTQIVNYANMIIDVFKVVAISAKTYLQDGLKFAIDAAVASMVSMSSSVATQTTAMTTAIGAWIRASTTSIGAFVTGPLRLVQTGLTTLSTSTKSITTSMTTYIGNFAKAAGTSFNQVTNSSKTANTALSTMSKSVSTYMSSMSNAVSKFGSAFTTSISKVKTQADNATRSVKALKSAIDSLKNKSITVHVGLSGPGVPYMRHGGATLNFPSESGVSYAAGGKSWLQKTPKKIGNTHVAETFPEIVSVMPLDPREKNSPFNNKKTINKNIHVPMPEMIPSTTAGGGGGGNSRQPINVELHTTISMPNGKVLAKAVQEHLLSGFSGIT